MHLFCLVTEKDVRQNVLCSAAVINALWLGVCLTRTRQSISSLLRMVQQERNRFELFCTGGEQKSSQYFSSAGLF